MKFEKDYFIDSSISNYVNYPEKTFKQQAEDLINYFGLREKDRILDFGCACGGLLRELKKRGYENIKGTDISFWAIDFGKENFDLGPELEHYNRNLLAKNNDYVFLLDVLEHIPFYETEFILDLLGKNPPEKYVLMRVPVSEEEGKDFALEVSRNDKTHIQRHSKDWWEKLFNKFGFVLNDKPKMESIYDSEGVFVGVFKYEGKRARSNEKPSGGAVRATNVPISAVV